MLPIDVCEGLVQQSFVTRTEQFYRHTQCIVYSFVVIFFWVHVFIITQGGI